MGKHGLLAAAALLVLSGCGRTLRAMPMGYGAGAVGAGRAEAGLSPGLNYSKLEQEEDGPDATTSTLQVPIASGFMQYGFTDSLGLTLRSAGNGLRPGLKITLLEGQLDLALLPEAGVEYISQEQESEGSDQETSGLGLGLAGHLLLSHRSGIFGSVGYGFGWLEVESETPPIGGTPGESSESTLTEHTLSATLGYAIKGTHLDVRPELAFAFLVSSEVEPEDGDSQDGPTGWALFAGVTFAAGSAR